MSANLTLVRHASYIDPPVKTFETLKQATISVKGENEIRRLSKDLAEKEFSAIFSSPYVRALESAERFCAFSPNTHGMILVDEDLSERNSGVLVGMDISVETLFNLWQLESLESFSQFGVESLSDLQFRAERFLDKVVTSFNREEVIAFSHSGFILAVYSVVFGTPEFGNLLSFPILGTCEYRTFTLNL